jgi:hypothetical protein
MWRDAKGTAETRRENLSVGKEKAAVPFATKPAPDMGLRQSISVIDMSVSVEFGVGHDFLLAVPG